MTKKLLILCPKPSDATSFYRGVGPFSELESRRGHGWEFVVHDSPTLSWSDLAFFDAVFMQRPFKPQHAEVLKLAKSMGKPIWVDYDDDLFTIPFSNPAHETYADERVQKNLSRIGVNADIITVSTDALLKRYLPINANTRILPNAWNQSLAPKRPENDCTEKFILWRGSRTHDEDMEAYIDVMAKSAKENPDWRWVFVGAPLWKVQNAIKNHLIVPAFDIPRYFNFIASLKPSISIVPLKENDFNQSKSNIAWQEATYAGACTVCPLMKEWLRPGALNYNGTEQFHDQLEWAMNATPKERRQQCNKSWAWIKTKESLSVVNNMRIDLLNEITRNPR